ncbi:MAG TPA: type II secretion system protein GspC [Nitrospiria bacterium]|jgi:general secretion pathway protein C|nr:type II secretion system protein GspC [Nitrospiria bacterium]
MKRYLWTLNILFLLGFSYFVADLVSLFIGRQLDLPARSPAVEWAATTEAQVKPTTEVYSSIVDRNIFGIKPASAIAPPQAVAPEPVQLPPLRVRLVGTSVGEADESLAVIEDLGTKEQRVYHIDDLLEPDAKLIEVERNEVTFLRGKIRETVTVEEGDTPTQTPPGQSLLGRPASAVPAVIPRSTGTQNSWVLDKQEVASALENLPQLLTKARVVPDLTPDGKSDGFRIVSIAPASFYERIGLRNGDVIQRINGIEVKDPQSFMQVFTQLKDETNISMDLMRNNQKESFSYEIR